MGKNDYMKKACDVLAQIRSPVERDIFISRVAKEQGISKDAVEQQVKSIMNYDERKRREKRRQESLAFAQRRDPLNPDAVTHVKENLAEQQLIYYVYNHPDRCKYLLERCPPDRFVTELNARIYGSLTSKIVAGEDYSFSTFYGEFSPEQVDRIVRIIDDYADKGIDSDVAEASAQVLIDYCEKQSLAPKDDVTDDDLENLINSLRSKK